jgi:hypothetical protein
MQGLNGILMKFILTIYVCSFIDFTCAKGVSYPMQFDTWSECVSAAYQESQIIIKSLPPQMVEANRLATKYTCQQLIGA